MDAVLTGRISVVPTWTPVPALTHVLGNDEGKQKEFRLHAVLFLVAWCGQSRFSGWTFVLVSQEVSWYWGDCDASFLGLLAGRQSTPLSFANQVHVELPAY